LGQKIATILKMKILIRKADEIDFPEIIDLINEFALFQKTPKKVSITLAQMIKDKDIFQCLVAVSDNEIVGFATYFFTYHSWTGKGLHLDDLYVKESFRKSGTGKRILDHIINLAKKEECKNVRWMVSSWNLNAIDFYKKIGATVDEVDLGCNLKID
jgi:GNAT superfamily N-acetyltransferase